MTVYQVHHSWTPGEDKADVQFDEMPEWLFEVWEVEEGTRWSRHGDDWSADVPNSIEVPWWTLLEEWGPVTDERPKGCPVCGPSGCTGHARYGDDLLPMGGDAA